MKQNQKLNELNQEYSKFENETKKLDLLNNKYKENISKEIKKLDKNKIFNSTYVENKFTLWQRIMRVFGMN
jgi:hypothetical protein